MLLAQNSVGYNYINHLVYNLCHAFSFFQRETFIANNSHTILVQLHRRKKIHRQKIGRSFIYLAGDSRIEEKQRHAMSLINIKKRQVPAEISLLILVEFIRNPEAGFMQLSKTIKRSRKITVEACQIEELFQQYALKKTILTGGQPHGEH